MAPTAAPDNRVRLREAGLRVTQQRLAVLDYLVSTTAHPTAEQIGDALNRRHPQVSRASVYNVLHSLRDAALVSEVVAGDAITRYDANLGPHHHFLCRVCGSLEDIPAYTPQPLPRPGDGRAVESCEITWRGVCPPCARDTR